MHTLNYTLSDIQKQGNESHQPMGATEEPPPASLSDPFQGLRVPTGCSLLCRCHARCVLMKRGGGGGGGPASHAHLPKQNKSASGCLYILSGRGAPSGSGKTGRRGTKGEAGGGRCGKREEARGGGGVRQTRALATEKRWTVAAAPSLFASAVSTPMHKTTSSTGGSAPGLIYSARVHS